MFKTLIHTTKIIEAKAIIDFFGLEEIKKNHTYSNKKIVLIISGISKKEIFESLEYVFTNFKINKAINIGIASCCDSSIKIGTLFCTNRLIFGLNFANIKTIEKKSYNNEEFQSYLIDKERNFFKELCEVYIKDFYMLKIVSDYFDDEKLDDKKYFELISNSINRWEKLI